MYASYFGLRQAPFSIAPDPRYLFMSERHREALAHLLYGVGGGGGFVLLTGEIGAGKTTVCRCFLEQIPRRCNVAYIFNPKLDTHELLQAICDEFRIPVPRNDSGHGSGHGGERPSLKTHVDSLNEYLLKTHAVGQNNVLIIDEAQNLSPEVLEQLRLLTNLETSERKLLQIILIGQPELRQMLARPELEQMAQRVIARFHLDALSEAETAQYIQHRLMTAGLKRGSLFDAAAVKRIHLLSKGVPRRINLLCDRALLGAYAEGKTKVGRRIVDKAAAEVFEGQGDPTLASTTDEARRPRKAPAQSEAAAPPPWPKWTWAVFGSGVALSLAGLALTAWLHAAPNAATRRPLLTADSAASTGAPRAGAADVQARAAKAATAEGGASVKQSPTSGFGPMPPLVDASEVLRRATPTEALAWRDLAGLWRVELADGDPCAQARTHQLICFRNSAGLGLLTALDRPALLTLQDGSRGIRHAVLLRLQGQEAWLQMGEDRVRLPLNALSSLWRGDFATLWRAPQGYRAKLQIGQSGPVVDWLAARLSQVDKLPAPAPGSRFDASLQARLQVFQLSQGLKPDGVAGASTFMQLNRVTGADEPRLLSPSPQQRQPAQP